MENGWDQNGSENSQARQNGVYSQSGQDGAYGQGGQNGAYSQSDQSGAYGQGGQNGAYSQGVQDGAYSQSAQGGAYSQGVQNGAYSQGTQNGAYSREQSDGYYGSGEQRGSYGYEQPGNAYRYRRPDGGAAGGRRGERNARRRRGSGAKIAVAVTLAAVFIGFCGFISWLAVESIQDQMAQVSRKTPEETVLPEKQPESAPSEEAAQPSEPVQSASPVRESGSVTTVVTDVTDVVESVMPACVSVTNNFTEQIQDFWGQTYSRDGQGSGSGIIIGQNETELLIVSNNHVVDSADSLQVQFIDGAVVEAQVKGTDPVVDLAVIAVKLEDISPETKDAIVVAMMGDSDNLKIGEPAIAIGNALGYGQSVTTGVISALNRTLEVSETGESSAMIQTDAAINPGNSGGALLNINGEVIGINSSKTYGSAIEGMGYAIPISTARPIIEELMTHETRSRYSDEDRGYLGISCINVTSDLSANFDLPEGIFVAQVYKGTGAERAGLKRGDIITAFNGVEVRNQEELNGQMEYFKAGETVEITVMQNTGAGYQGKQVELVLSSLKQLNESSQQEESRQSGWGSQLWP